MKPHSHPNHLFVIDPIESLNLPLDSSLRMMYGLAQRGHTIHICESKDLLIRGQTSNQPNHAKLEITREVRASSLSFGSQSSYKSLKFTVATPTIIHLHSFQAIHMRKDPPFDLDYITTTWLLDDLPSTTKVYNRPEALRRHNEKILITHFPQAIAPILVTANADALLEFVESHQDIVLKPLNLFGGRGVLRLSLHIQNIHDIKKTLVTETNQGHSLRLAQPFNPQIVDGEVRVFTAFGKPLAWCLKRPKSGDFLANTRAGASLHSFVPSNELLKNITEVAETLRPQGIELIGFDVIGDKISEINITSPRLLLPEGAAQEKIYGELATMFETDLAAAV